MIPMVRTSKPASDRSIRLGPWPHGLNVATNTGLLATTELQECVNWWIQRGGILQVRPGLVQVTSSAMPATPVAMFFTTLGGGTLLVATAGGDLYRVAAGVPTLISSGLESDEVGFVEFGGQVLVLDGGRIKILDSSWTLSLAYDAGDGASGYMMSNLSLDADTTVSMHSGGAVRVAAKFTTPTWATGFTIPPVRVEAMLGAVGSPTGSITAAVRRVSDDAVLASTEIATADELPTTGSALFKVTFPSVSAEMSPSTDYYVTLEYASGDSSNYVTVDCETVGSGGDLYTYTSSWVADATKRPLLALSPGLPPKGRFGCVWNSRPWVAGDPDNPGVVHFGNLSALDWSTANGGGYISAVDENATTYEVGAVQPLFGELYLIGTPTSPYLCQISGQQPSEYVQRLLFQSGGARQALCKNVVNDIWFCDGDQAWALSGVEQYGDVRANSIGDPVEPMMRDHGALEFGYYPALGLIATRLSESPQILVCNTKAPTADPMQTSIRYPWSVWELYEADYADTDQWAWQESLSELGAYYLTDAAGSDPGIDEPAALVLNGRILTKVTDIGDLTEWTWYYGDVDALGYNTLYLRPKNATSEWEAIHDAMIPLAFANDDERLYVAAGDGHIYSFDEDQPKDLGDVNIYPRFRSGLVSPPSPSALVRRVWPDIYCRMGAFVHLDIFTAASSIEYAERVSLAIPMDDSVTVGELATVEVDDAAVLMDPGAVSAYRQRVEVWCVAFNLRVILYRPVGPRSYARSVTVVYRPLRY